jgi:cell division protein FtsA
LPAGVVIVGGGANLPGIEELAKNYLKLPTKIGRFQGLTDPTELIKNPAWSTAVGIALYGLENSKNPFMRGKSGAFLRWLRTFLP